MKVGVLNPRYVTFSNFLLNGRIDVLAKQLSERLEIEADTPSEAIDFVKQTLIDIAADDIGIKDIDKPGASWREQFNVNGGAA